MTHESSTDMHGKNSCDCGCQHGGKNYAYKHYQKSSGGAVYGLGVVGALIYYVSMATSFWPGVLAILKSFVWPAFLVYELLKYLHA